MPAEPNEHRFHSYPTWLSVKVNLSAFCSALHPRQHRKLSFRYNHHQWCKRTTESHVCLVLEFSLSSEVNRAQQGALQGKPPQPIATKWPPTKWVHPPSTAAVGPVRDLNLCNQEEPTRQYKLVPHFHWKSVIQFKTYHQYLWDSNKIYITVYTYASFLHI